MPCSKTDQNNCSVRVTRWDDEDEDDDDDDEDDDQDGDCDGAIPKYRKHW